MNEIFNLSDKKSGKNLNIEIIQESDKNNPFLVVYKPKGLPSAPLIVESHCS